MTCGSDDQNNSIHEHFGDCRDDEDDIEDNRRREQPREDEEQDGAELCQAQGKLRLV